MRYYRRQTTTCAIAQGRTYYNVTIFRDFETREFAIYLGRSNKMQKPIPLSRRSEDGNNIEFRVWFENQTEANEYYNKANNFLNTWKNEREQQKEKEEGSQRPTLSGCNVYTYRQRKRRVPAHSRK